MKIEEKPITNEARQLVHHIVDKMFDYNNTPTEQELTGDKPTFYVVLSGHIGAIDVYCNPNGYRDVWEQNYCGQHNTRLCGNWYKAEKEILADLNRTIADMDRYYNDWLSRQEAAPDV